MLCKKCRVDKTEDQFEETIVRGQNFRRKTCRCCISQRRKTRYHLDVEKTKLKRREWYERSGKEKYKARYETNKDKIHQYRLKHRTSPEGRAYQMWKNARTRGGSTFDVSREKITEIVSKGVCQRSGVAFDFSIPNGKSINAFAPSIDKIDRNKGYRNDNVQIVAWCYNSGKGEMSDGEFIAFCKAVAEFNK